MAWHVVKHRDNSRSGSLLIHHAFGLHKCQ